MKDVSGCIIQEWQNAGGTVATVNGRENHKWHTGKVLFPQQSLHKPTKFCMFAM
jgi:hypothetical protein